MYSLTPGRGCELIVTNEMAHYTVFAVTIQSSINCLYMSDCACSRSLSHAAHSFYLGHDGHELHVAVHVPSTRLIVRFCRQRMRLTQFIRKPQSVDHADQIRVEQSDKMFTISKHFNLSNKLVSKLVSKSVSK